MVTYEKWTTATTAPGANGNGVSSVMPTGTTGEDFEGCLQLAAPAEERGLSLAWSPSAGVGDELAVDIFTPGVPVWEGG